MRIILIVSLLVTMNACYADCVFDCDGYLRNKLQRDADRMDTMLMINSQASQVNAMWYASQQTYYGNNRSPQVYNDAKVTPQVIEKPLYGVKLGE